MSKRTCGDCIVCCVYPRIKSPTLNKQPMAHCEYLTLPGLPIKNTLFFTGPSNCGNCKIYPSNGEKDQRPQCCDEYKCLWVLGYGAEEDRPDKSLMLFDRSRDVENAIEAKPLVSNQEESQSGKDTIKRMTLSTKTPVIVFNLYENNIVRVIGLPIK